MVEAGEPKRRMSVSGELRGSDAASMIRQKIQEAIDKSTRLCPSYETIKRFTVLDRDFAQETGELTPTMKVKRKACTQKYKKETRRHVRRRVRRLGPPP